MLVCTSPFRTQQYFAGQNSAGLYYTEQNYAAIGYNFADLRFALLHYSVLCLTKFGYNFAMLRFTKLNIAKPR